MSLTSFRENLHPIAQQTVVLMKTSSVFVFRRHLDQGQYIRLGLTSSRRLQDVFKTSSRCLAKTSLKTSSKRLQTRLAEISSTHLQGVFKVFSRHLQDVFKTSSRHLAKMSSRRFQDVSSS